MKEKGKNEKGDPFLILPILSKQQIFINDKIEFFTVSILKGGERDLIGSFVECSAEKRLFQNLP